MKAKDFNGSISTWRRLPKTYKSATKYYTAFDKASKDIIEAEGFYDVVKPSYDSISQKLGSIEFDSEKKVFTYPVIDIDFDATYEVMGEDMEPTGETLPVYNIDKLKSDKKIAVNTKAGELLKPTDWYVIRFTERQIAVPDSVATEREDIVTKANGFTDAIDALETVESVLRYSFEFYPSEDLV